MHANPRPIRALAGLVLFLLGASIAGSASGEYFVYVGTYTLRRGKGIYTFRFQPATGKVTAVSLAAETPSPSFLAVHPNRKFLYAANEHDGPDVAGKNSTVSAYAIDPKTGALTLLNRVSCRGEGPLTSRWTRRAKLCWRRTTAAAAWRCCPFRRMAGSGR